MNKKEYLNEEKFQKTKKSIKKMGLLILIIGISIAGFLIFQGVQRVTNNYKTDELAIEKAKLEKMKENLINKGITPSSDYNDGEAYDLHIINEALDPSFSHCRFDECKNNELTKEYCKIKNANGGNGMGGMFIAIGVFIIIGTLIFSSAIIFSTHTREIMSYQAQQIMPIAQEGIEKMAPTMANVAKKMAPAYKEVVKEMAPAYKEVAKEISKGIKEGMNEADNNKE